MKVFQTPQLIYSNWQSSKFTQQVNQLEEDIRLINIKHDNSEYNFSLILSSIARLQKKVHAHCGNPLQKSGAITGLAYSLFQKLETMKDEHAKSKLKEKTVQYLPELFGLLDDFPLSHLIKFMTYPTAMQFSYACKRTFRMVQANSAFAKRKFKKMEAYLEKKLSDYTNIDHFKISCSRKLIIYADSHDLTKVLQTHPQVFKLCHLLLIRRSKECVRLQEKINEQVQKIHLLSQKQNHSLEKLRALESTIELLRNGSLDEEKQFDELESLEEKRQKKSNKFISRGKEINKSKELLNTNNQILEHFINGKDVDLYLNALNTNVGTRFNLNHVGVLQQSQASSRLYFKFTLKILEESINSLEARKTCLSTVEENLLAIDKVAWFFANEKPMEGLEAFKHLNQDFQNKVYFFLYLNCKIDRTPDHPPSDILRPQYGEEAFWEKNGIAATPTDRLRAIMSLREFVRIKHSTKTSKAYKGNKELLFDCYHAFLEDPEQGMLLFQNLAENTKNLIYRVHWTNLIIKRYVISDQMQAMLNISKVCTDPGWPKECGAKFFHDDNCTNSFERATTIETFLNR